MVVVLLLMILLLKLCCGWVRDEQVIATEIAVARLIKRKLSSRDKS